MSAQPSRLVRLQEYENTFYPKLTGSNLLLYRAAIELAYQHGRTDATRETLNEMGRACKDAVGHRSAEDRRDFDARR